MSIATTKTPRPKPKPVPPKPVKVELELVPLDRYKRVARPPSAREENIPDEPEFRLPDPYAKPVTRRPPSAGTAFTRMAELADQANARAEKAEGNLRAARDRIAKLETRLARLGAGVGTAADEKPVRLAEGGGR